MGVEDLARILPVPPPRGEIGHVRESHGRAADGGAA